VGNIRILHVLIRKRLISLNAILETLLVSAAVPAPQHMIFGEMKCIFSQFLFATTGPFVLLVSAHKITPDLYVTPTIVVPVLIGSMG
jgi:hypothetical protein